MNGITQFFVMILVNKYKKAGCNNPAFLYFHKRMYQNAED